MTTLRRGLPSLLLVGGLIVAWEIVARVLAIDPIVLPAPSRILSALWDARGVAASQKLRWSSGLA